MISQNYSFHIKDLNKIERINYRHF